MTWSWRFEGHDGATLQAGQVLLREPDHQGEGDVTAAPATFPTQGDAESWLGENWRALHAAGAAGATLLEEARVVYGPLSLAPE